MGPHTHTHAHVTASITNSPSTERVRMCCRDATCSQRLCYVLKWRNSLHFAYCNQVDVHTSSKHMSLPGGGRRRARNVTISRQSHWRVPAHKRTRTHTWYFYIYDFLSRHSEYNKCFGMQTIGFCVRIIYAPADKLLNNQINSTDLNAKPVVGSKLQLDVVCSVQLQYTHTMYAMLQSIHNSGV